VDQHWALLRDVGDAEWNFRASVSGPLEGGGQQEDQVLRWLADSAIYGYRKVNQYRQGSIHGAAVSFDDMVALILEIVTAIWRLRGCALYILQGTREGLALGAVEGEWDGNASYVR
jgi:hypothetical protein